MKLFLECEERTFAIGIYTMQTGLGIILLASEWTGLFLMHVDDLLWAGSNNLGTMLYMLNLSVLRQQF